MSDTGKDKNNMSLIKKDTFSSKNIAQYTHNEYERFIILKTEKLGSAIYVVTNFVQENDPIRQKLRSLAVDLTSLAASIGVYGAEVDVRMKPLCIEMSGLLSMAERAGLVSSMNGQVLSDEYASLIDFIGQHKDYLNPSKTLAFEPMAPLPQAKRVQVRTPIKDKIRIPDKRHSDRRSQILDLFKDKEAISVKDAAIAIGNVSEKTVQRELLSMVDEGVLLKEGERRWSTYKKV